MQNSAAIRRFPVHALAAVLLPVLAVLILASAAPVCAQNPASIEQALESERHRARESRKALTRLTRQERTLHGDLAAVEDTLDALKQKIRNQENELAAIRREHDAARDDGERLAIRQAEARRGLGELIRALWPLRVAEIRGRSAGDETWAEGDRRFAWGTALYADADRALKDIRSRALRIDKAVERTEILKRQAGKRLTEINARKDELLSKRLDFVRDIRKVRAQRINREQALDQILAAVKDLDYRLKNASARRFGELKGSLPAPVRGTALPDGGTGRNSRKGVGFATAENAPVAAVYWGKVVYDDMLRGYGRVIILYHGDDYYTLYAFLGETSVNQGQEVEKGEPVGTSGYYPAAKGPGVYFELRLGQKAINPVHWLAGQG